MYQPTLTLIMVPVKFRGIFAQANTAIKPIFEEWFKPFADLGASTVTLANTGSTDHLSFDWAGIPGFQFIQDPIDYETRTHHSNMDNYDHLKMDDLKQAAVIVASFVYQTSVRPDMMPSKTIEKGTFCVRRFVVFTVHINKKSRFINAIPAGGFLLC